MSLALNQGNNNICGGLNGNHSSGEQSFQFFSKAGANTLNTMTEACGITKGQRYSSTLLPTPSMRSMKARARCWLRSSGQGSRLPMIHRTVLPSSALGLPAAEQVMGLLLLKPMRSLHLEWPEMSRPLIDVYTHHLCKEGQATGRERTLDCCSQNTGLPFRTRVFPPHHARTSSLSVP